MTRRFSRFLMSLAFVATAAISVGGCGDDETEMVTVSGVVFNIDTLAPAEGVVVWLIDHKEINSGEATGADGAFTIEVPKGSPNALMTDDFADFETFPPARISVNTRAAFPEPFDDYPLAWFPLINTDLSHTPTIEENMEGLPIHACPNPVTSSNGAIMALDYYMAEADTNEGYFAPVTTVMEAGAGVVALATFFLENGNFGDQSGLGVSIEESEWPEVYGSFDGIMDPVTFTIAADRGPNAMLPSPATTETDGSGFFYSIADPAEFDGDTVTVTYTHDTYDFGASFEVPVRPYAYTLLLPVAIDGVGGKTVKEAFEALNFL